MTPIKLRVLGSHVPAMKNSKMLITKTRGKQLKKPMLITKPERQRWMDETIQSFVSQLRFFAATTADGTLTAHSVRSLIASLPADDSWQWIPEITIKAVECDKGNEGAEVLIEPL